MASSVELGRAVLASTTQNFELWLRTVISVSPTQGSIDIQQLSSHSLLGLLSSRDVWVSRGVGMQIELALTHRGEPFPVLELHKLRDRIIQAPVWSQLKLRPTVSSDDVLQDGITHIAINHVKDNDSNDNRPCHRIFKDVPAADIRPPDSFPIVQLQVVRFTMDILDSKIRPPIKRSDTTPTENLSPHLELGDDEDGMLNTPLHDMTTAADTAIPTNRKRKRSVRQAPPRTCSSPTLSFPPRLGHKSERYGVTIIDSKFDQEDNGLKEQLAEIYVMVDGAMRLSICRIIKPPSTIKVKANTFVLGLADVAPILWRPAYLAALSYRAHLIPTVCSSLGRVTLGQATTVSLSEKAQVLAASSPGIRQDNEDDGQSRAFSSSLVHHLWFQLQKSLVARSAPPLQACVLLDREVADSQETNVILESISGPQDTRGALLLAIDSNRVSRRVGSDTKKDSMSPTTWKVHPGDLDDLETTETVARFPTPSEDDLLLESATSPVEVRHHHIGFGDLRTDTQASARREDSSPFDMLVTCGYSTIVGMGERRSALVSNPDREVPPQLPDQEQPADKDLLFDSCAGQ